MEQVRSNEVNLPDKKFASLSDEQLAKLKERYVEESEKLAKMDQKTWERTIHNPEGADAQSNIKAVKKSDS